jgi:hypothetical protein
MNRRRLCLQTPLAAAIILAFTGAMAEAQTSGQTAPPSKPAAQATQTGAPKKPPAPLLSPLFPRHRRGIYVDSNGYNVVDATPQSPPLGTDDPGVPDKGEWEINLSTVSTRSVEAHQVDLLRVDANYGMLPKIGGRELPAQLKFEFPISGTRAGDEPFAFGFGAVNTGIKLSLYSNDHAGSSVSVYPQIESAMPRSNGVEKGLAEPGQTLIFPLLLEKEFHLLILVGNIGVEKPIHVDPGPAADATATYSIAIGRALSRRIAAMVELRGESAFASGGERGLTLNAGIVRGVHDIIIYGNIGHSLSSSDGVARTYLGVGVKLLLDPHKSDKPDKKK